MKKNTFFYKLVILSHLIIGSMSFSVVDYDQLYEGARKQPFISCADRLIKDPALAQSGNAVTLAFANTFYTTYPTEHAYLAFEEWGTRLGRTSCDYQGIHAVNDPTPVKVDDELKILSSFLGSQEYPKPRYKKYCSFLCTSEEAKDLFDLVGKWGGDDPSARVSFAFCPLEKDGSYNCCSLAAYTLRKLGILIGGESPSDKFWTPEKLKEAVVQYTARESNRRFIKWWDMNPTEIAALNTPGRIEKRNTEYCEDGCVETTKGAWTSCVNYLKG